MTQRTILSFVSSVFDPLGLLAPFTMRVRILLKSIWIQYGQRWDGKDGKVILGQAVYPLIRPLEYKTGGRNEPWAVSFQ